MLTVNLEKELLKENRIILNKREQLLVNHLDKVAIDDVAPLERMGMSKHIEEANALKKKFNNNLEDTKRFNQERVFHISQIESICNKYRLKFLPSCLYKGILDNELVPAIQAFEIAYNVSLFSNKPDSNYMNIQPIYSNSFIIAPEESFVLQEKPLDPLLFYKINDDYFYLVHKWGNDLNVFRYMYAMLGELWIAPVIAFVATGIAGVFCINTIGYNSATVVIPTVVFFITFVYGLLFEQDKILPEHKYRKPFKN